MRLSVQIAIFLILLNGFATAMGTAGATDVLGANPSVGGDQAIGESEQEANSDSIRGSGVVGAVDLAAFVVSGAFSIVSTIKDMTVAGPTMLINAGLPTWLVTFVFTPMYLIVFIDLYGFVKSGD